MKTITLQCEQTIDNDGNLYSTKYRLNGELHNEFGPSIVYVDGEKYWYLNGELHRTDGPAIEYASGTKIWFINGKELTEEEFNSRNKSDCSGKTVTIDGKEYKLTPA